MSIHYGVARKNGQTKIFKDVKIGGGITVRLMKREVLQSAIRAASARIRRGTRTLTL